MFLIFFPTGKFTTPVWRFFKNDKTHAVCLICDRTLKLHTTSVLVRHLRCVHHAEYQEYREEYANQRQKISVKRSVNVKRMLVMKNADDPDADCITENDLAVLQQGNIRILNVYKKQVEDLSNDVNVVFVDEMGVVQNQGTDFMVVSGHEELDNSVSFDSP